MMTAHADPLADIPEREKGAARGDWRELIFTAPFAVRPSECMAIRSLFNRYAERGRAFGPPHARRVDSVWLGGLPHPKEGFEADTIVPEGLEKVAYRISGLIQLHNTQHWNFNIIPFPRMCVSSHVLLDRQTVGGKGVDWHSDYTCDPKDKAKDFEPKVVAIVQLSTPAEYSGGQLEIYSGTQIVRPKLEQGDMVLFPNFLLHRRKPLTRGVRFGLITLAWGPCWR